jgi:drug/metabolite transporter (DMT)-like permease
MRDRDDPASNSAAQKDQPAFQPAGKHAHKHADWLTRLAPVLFLLLWSTGFPLAKMGLRYASPMALLAWRFGLTVAVLLPLFVILRPPLPRNAAAWRQLIVAGFLIQTMYFGLSYLAFNAGISAGLAALIASLQPLLVSLLAPKLVGEHIALRQWVGLFLGLAGAAGVIVVRSRVEVESLWGVVLITGALFGITAAMFYEKRYGTPQHPVTANLVQYTVGFVTCAPAALWLEHARVQWTGEFVAVLAYLVIGNSLVAISLLLAMSRAGKVSRVASLFLFVPPLAAAMSWLLLGEAMPPLAWVAMAVAALGVFIGASSRAGDGKGESGTARRDEARR